jgi:hypothetical protein
MLAFFIVYACVLSGLLVAVGFILWDCRIPRRPHLSRPAPLETMPDPEGTHYGTGAQRSE